MAGLLGRMDEHLQQLYGRPTFHLGLGLLGRRDQDFGRAASGAFNDYANWQTQNQLLQNQQQAYQLAQAEEMRQQQEAAAQQQAMAQRAAWMQQNMPRLMGAPAEFQKEAFKAQFAQPKSTDDLREYQTAVQQGFKGTFMDYMKAVKPLSASKTTVENIMPSLHKGVERDAQSAVMSAQAALEEAGVAAEFLEQAPELANPFARAMTTAGSLISGLGEFTGSSAIKQAGEMVRPDPVYTESGEKVTPRTIRAQMLSLKTAAREIMAPDKGPLTRQEQTDYKEAVGLLESADAEEQLDGVRQLKSVMTRRVKRLERTLRVSGGAVPGEQQMPRPTSPAERDKLPSGTQYIAPDGTVRVRK